MIFFSSEIKNTSSKQIKTERKKALNKLILQGVKSV